MADRRAHPFLGPLKQQLAERRLGRREFLRTATLLGLSAGAAYACVGKVYGPQAIPGARAEPASPLPMTPSGVLKVAARVPALDRPHAFDWPLGTLITHNVIPMLTMNGPDNLTRPVLLDGWEASDDLRTWTFRIREGARWHDGRPLLSEDLAWMLNHVLDPATGSSSIGLFKSYLLEDVEENDDAGNPVTIARLWDSNAIEPLDARTLRINTRVPHLAVPEDLYHYTNAVTDPAEAGVFGVGSNGTGPFALVDHEVGTRAVLKAIPDHWLGTARIGEIQFIDFGDDPSASVAALASGQVDVLPSIAPSQLPTLAEQPDLVVQQSNTAATAVVQMKMDRQPFDKPEVRKAMRLALDAEACVSTALQSRGLPAEHHHVCPVHPEYAVLPHMGPDPEAAKALLAQAGYPDGLDLKFYCKQDPAWELAAVQAMVEDYRAAGIRCSIKVLPSAQFWDDWDKVDLAFVSWGHRPLGTMALSLGYRSGVPWNVTGYANPDFDALLDQAQGTLDIEARRALMAELQSMLQEDGPIAQPVWVDSIAVSQRRVHGFQPNALAFFDAAKTWIES